MTLITNVHTTSTAVHDGAAITTESGVRVAPAEARASEIAEQASHWLAFATERTRMRHETLLKKALSSVAFSVHHGASSFAVPSKLAGTSKHQRALWALVRNPAEPWTTLSLDATDDGITVSYDDETLGTVQTKHLGWARPLLPFGLTVHLNRVTGHEHAEVSPRYRLGGNVAFGHVGSALDRLLDALGETGGPSASGDGATTAEPSVCNASASGRLRLVVQGGCPIRPEDDTLRSGYDPSDVVLYRQVDGTACASVDHIVRHSPSGIEWGYTGSGPADLARSVLLAITDESTVERCYQAFKAEVLAHVPFAGGVLRAADVRRWLARHSA